MADTPTDGLDTPTPDAPDAAAAVESLRNLFDTLVPPKTITLQDALGNEYTARGMLPARSQIIVMQHLQRLWEADASALEVESTGNGIADATAAVLKMAGDPVILDGVCAAFGAAHPKLVKDAAAAMVADGLESTDDPAELFPLEELVAGLVPFFIRFAARAANLMNAVTASPETAQA